MRGSWVLVGWCALVLGGAVLPGFAAAQASPLGYVTARGATVTPAYEGWYRNRDGTITLSWGFYNRNSEEDLDIPIGLDNFIEPAELDGVQPSHLPAGRQWGAFGVVVPAEYDGVPVRWTLRIRGGTFTVPANLGGAWRIDATGGDALGNTPPELSFAEGGAWFAGPGGTVHDVTAVVGEPVKLTVWAKDDGVLAGLAEESSASEVELLTLAWYKHSGPGGVTFENLSPESPVEPTGGAMSTRATFDEPGEYMVRGRVNDASGIAAAGHVQCCWSNAFFRVTVGG